MISVLYVDDEEPLLYLGKTFLEKQSPDFHVDTAKSAQRALEMLGSGHYDVIVSDYQMAGMDGITLLKEVRSRGNTIPFIVFTGRGREEIVIQAINLGADYYLQKGGDPKAQFAELIHQIRQAVAKRRAEEELRESRKRLADIIDFLPDAVFAIDQEGRVIAWNRAIEEMTGISAREMIGKGDREYSIPFYGDRRPILIDFILSPGENIPDHYSLSTREKNVLIAETDQPRPRGERRILFGKASPLYDENGTIVGAIESIRDITDYKWSERRLREALQQISNAEERIRSSISELDRREELLRESEKKYETLFNQAADIIAIIDTEGKILGLNQRFEEESQWDPREVIGKDVFSAGVIAPEFHDLIARYLKDYKEGRAIPAFEIEGIQKSGKRVPYEIRISPLVLNGRVVAIQTILRNLTERRIAEDALRRSESLYQALFENTGTATIVIEEDAIISHANTQFQNLTGYSKEEIEGKMSWTEFVVDEDREWMLNQHRRRRGTSQALTYYEFGLRNRAGEVKRIYLTIDMIPGTKKSIASLLDITNFKNAESIVQRLNKNISLFHDVTIQDISNKVTATQGYLELLDENNKDPSLNELIKSAKSSVGSIDRNIQIARKYGDLGMEAPRWHDLEAAISAHAPRGVRVNTSCHGLAVYADPLLEHVFASLFDNSLRRGGDVTSISIECSKRGHDLVIRYQDNGEGIAEAEKEKIFERGYGRHTGYELFMAREFLAITGISIKELGAPGDGAVFEITVPGGAWRQTQ